MSAYANFQPHHFLDPAPVFTDLGSRMTDHEFASREVVVMGTKRTSRDPQHRVGERTKLHPTQGRAIATSGTNGWFVDVNGDHVIGQLSTIPGAQTENSRILGVTDDGVWVYGEITRRHQRRGEGEEASNGWTVRPQGSSDGLTTPHSLAGAGGGSGLVRIRTGFKPASWAAELFPEFSDSDELVKVKLELADKNWHMRRAQYSLHVHAEYRRWTSLLSELDEAGFALPEAQRGFIISGSAMVPVTVPDELRTPLRAATPMTTDSERMERLRSRGATPGGRIETYAQVGFTLPIATVESATEVSQQNINYAFYERFGEEPVALSNVNQTRIVNGLGRQATL